MPGSLLELDDVRRQYRPRSGLLRRGGGEVRAVDGVSLVFAPGETVGVVGESGCGKSTLARMLVGLEAPSQGRVLWRGQDVSHLRGHQRRAFHRSVQLIFQDPYASLDPRRTVGESVAEGIITHDLLPARDVPARVAELLVQVGLDADHAHRFPHEFSGGQLQRIGIARALGVQPELLVCDEPVSALDVSVRAQVLNLLARLQRELGIAIVFIAHDLDVVRHMADRIVTMYLGRVVEEGPCADVYDAAAHPYTRALLSAIPRRPAPGFRIDRVVLEGDPPSPLDPPGGCPFHTRCYTAVDACVTTVPTPTSVRPLHEATCLLAHEVTASRVGQPRPVPADSS